MTVVSQAGGTGNYKYWLLQDITMSYNSNTISLVANQITFHDNTSGNPTFDWITRTNMVITDDSAQFLAYGTTGRGFAYCYDTVHSTGTDRCI